MYTQSLFWAIGACVTTRALLHGSGKKKTLDLTDGPTKGMYRAGRAMMMHGEWRWLKHGLGALWVHACGCGPCCCRKTSKQMTVMVVAWVCGAGWECCSLSPPPIQASTTHSPTHPSLPPSLPSLSFPSLRTEHNDESRRREFKTFQRSFLAVALLAMFSDWTQGPYSYALYAYYGYVRV
jgi:hypothetical protein